MNKRASDSARAGESSAPVCRARRRFPAHPPSVPALRATAPPENVRFSPTHTRPSGTIRTSNNTSENSETMRTGRAARRGLERSRRGRTATAGRPAAADPASAAAPSSVPHTHTQHEQTGQASVGGAMPGPQRRQIPKNATKCATDSARGGDARAPTVRRIGRFRARRRRDPVVRPLLHAHTHTHTHTGGFRVRRKTETKCEKCDKMCNRCSTRRRVEWIHWRWVGIEETRIANHEGETVWKKQCGKNSVESSETVWKAVKQ